MKEHIIFGKHTNFEKKIVRVELLNPNYRLDGAEVDTYSSSRAASSIRSAWEIRKHIRNVYILAMLSRRPMQF